MKSLRSLIALAAGVAFAAPLLAAGSAHAQEPRPWLDEPRARPPYGTQTREPVDDRYDQTAQAPGYPLPPPRENGYGAPPPPSYDRAPYDRPAYDRPAYDRPAYDRQSDIRPAYPSRDDAYRPPQGPQYGAPYSAPPPEPAYSRPYDSGRGGPGYYEPPPRRADYDEPRDGTFSMGEIRDAGHSFFGSLSQGLASVIEYAFKSKGRPNGYILGEDLGGAFVAGLRYGEGTLYTRDAGNHKVYWQGPSVGFDAGAEGSKVMVLVYNLRDPSEIYERFGGVAGSAYVVGGAGLTFQSNNHVILAPIRTGIGLRLGANIGYLKYTRRPTWNPF